MKNKALEIMNECAILIILILLINPFISAVNNKTLIENIATTQQFEFVILQIILFMNMKEFGTLINWSSGIIQMIQ